MKNFLYKAQLVQEELIEYRKQRKIDKEQRYRKFLAVNDNDLPGIEKLRRWRNYCFIIALICLAEPSMQILFFYSSMWYELSFVDFHIEVIYVFFSIGFFLFMFFGAMFDWCIYRRWGTQNALLDWI